VNPLIPPIVWALALQPDGRILVGGDFTVYNQTGRNRLMRLEDNSSLNPADFNYNGGADAPVYALALPADGSVLAGGAFTGYNGSSVPNRLMRLKPDGTLNNAATPLGGCTFPFNPGNTSGNTRTVSTAGTYTATDPATGYPYFSNPVTVTTAPLPVELTAFTATAVRQCRRARGLGHGLGEEQRPLRGRTQPERHGLRAHRPGGRRQHQPPQLRAAGP
jgi:hypothetical protein